MWRRRRALDDLDDDIRDHLQQEIDDGLARGLNPVDARREALLKFGNVAVIKEDTRAVWIGRWWDSLRFEARSAARSLARARGFTSIAVVSLALGIAASTTMFSVVHSVLLQPLPYVNPERLFNVAEGSRDEPPSWEAAYVSGTTYDAIRDQASSIERIAAYGTPPRTLQTAAGSVRLRTAAVSSSLFDLLGVRPIHGRFLRAEEDRPGASAVVVLSEGLWRDQFGADPAIMGRTVTLDEEPYAVIGVAPIALHFPFRDVALWTSHARRFGPQGDDGGSRWRDAVIVRLKPGVGVVEAATELTALAQRAAAATAPERNAESRMVPRIELFGLLDRTTRSVRVALFLLLGTALVLLLVVTANVANLCLIRARRHRHEFAVRAALGGSAARVSTGFAAQALMLAGLGGGLGVMMAFLFTHGLVAAAPEEFPRLHEIAVNYQALAFALGISVAAVMAGVLVPMAWSLRRNSRALTFAARDAYAPGRSRLSGSTTVLLLAQLGFSCALLIVGSLLGRSFLELTSVDPGYVPARVLTAQVALPPSMPPALQKDVARRLLDQLSSAPTVEAVGMTSALPLEKVQVMFEVRSGDDPRSRIHTAYRVVSPGYLETVGMRVVAGRTFTWNDDASSPLAAVVNESFARRYLNRETPIGTELASGVAGRPWVVVGIVQDVRYRGLDQPVSPTLYTSFVQRTQIAFFGRLDLVVRTTGDPRTFVPMFREMTHRVDDRLATYSLATMEEQLSASVARPRLYSGTVTTFAAASLVVSAIGLYGALGYAVTLRRREIAIRTAIGATASQVVRLVMRDVMVIAVVAVLAGGGVGVLAAHYLEDLLFGVERLDPITLTAAPMLILSLAVVASLLPVWKALSVSPATVLRSE